MKILLIGFYDYPYGADAYILENNELKPIDLGNDYDTIVDRHWDEQEKYEELKERLFSQFDMVIECDNGAYEILKGVK